jgi:hypothetical protein
MENLLVNPGFEEGVDGHRCLVLTPDPEAEQSSYVGERGEVNPPVGWEVWYVHDTRPPVHDPSNEEGWCEPETRLAPHAERVLSGEHGYLMFTFYRIHVGGLMQQVAVTPGDRLRFTTHAHAWVSNGDDPAESVGVGAEPFFALDGETQHDAATFWVGLDPTGGADPLAETVIWGAGAHIYNAYHLVPAVEAVAEAETVTVFTQGQFRYPFKHCDGYYDDATLVVLDAEDEAAIMPPRVPYERTYVLLPPTAGADWAEAVIDATWDARRFTLGGSADDAGFGLRDSRRVIAVNPEAWPHSLPGFFIDHYPGILYSAVRADSPDDLRMVLAQAVDDKDDDIEDPEPELHYDYPVIARGSKLHPHAIGEGGSYDLLVALADAGHPLPVIKMYCRTADEVWADRVKALSPETLVIARMAEGVGGDVEGVDPWTDAAEAYMRRLKPIFEANPEVDWWELWNEQDPPGIVGHVALAKFAVACMDFAEAWGVKLALMSYSSGVPEDDEWAAVWERTEFFERAKAGGHILSLHAYGVTEDTGELRYHLLRPMTLYENILIPNDCVVPYVFTEYSVDEEEPGTGITRWSVAELMDEYATMDDYLSAQWYCLGASVFTFGIGWEHYNHNEMWAPFRDRLLSLADRANETLPGADPNPETDWDITLYDQRDPIWADIRLGGTDYTMGRAGCAVTAATMVASQVSEMNPGEMVQWLNDHDGFTSGGLLWWSKIAEAVEGLAFVTYHTWRRPGEVANLDVVREVLDRGPAVMQVDFDPADSDLDTHFVTALWLEEGDVVVADPWTGEVVRLMETYGRGRPLEAAIFALAEYRIEDPAPGPGPGPEALVLLGFNDHLMGDRSAAVWMQAEGLPGLIVAPVFLGTTPRGLDYQAAADAGVRVIVNLRFSWSTDLGGAGTLPLPGTGTWSQFVDAALMTMSMSRGVYAWSLGNEANNPREFPQDVRLRPADIVRTYNYLWDRKGEAVRMAPGAFDPFNAQAGDPRDWLTATYEGIHGADLVTAHGYVRGPDPAQVGSEAMFEDPPLAGWQYLNYPGCVTALLDSLPARYQEMPVYVTEFNHIHRDDGAFGWVHDARAAAVIRAAYAGAVEADFAGVAVYRWTGDAWAVRENRQVLDAVAELLRS